MTRELAVLFCPGRGSYGRQELGSIARALRPGPVAEALATADAARRADGRPTVSELDAAAQFKPGTHLDGQNAAELIYFATLAHCESLRERYEIVAVAGNSLGWYTALPAAGCLDPSDGWRLVETMARLQPLAQGGQILTTTLDAAWRRDAALAQAIDDALVAIDAAGEFVARSIRLGGHEVLAGTERGVTRLLEILPKVETEGRAFPFRLAGHGPFHTRLCEGVAARAQEELASLPLDAPRVHLIDGRGGIASPWSGDPAAILDYTTRVQVTTTFDFTAAVRTALREIEPDVLLCAGPGTSLRAPVGHVVIAEGYRGLRSKDALFASGIVRAE